MPLKFFFFQTSSGRRCSLLMLKSPHIIYCLSIQLLIPLLFNIMGCQSSLSKVEPAPFESPSFRMRSSNLLFFRNTRSFYYVRIQDTLQPLEVYRWRAFADRPLFPQIQPLLLINTLNDRVVMLLSLKLPNGSENHDFQLILSHPSSPKAIDTLHCSPKDPPIKHHHLLARLYGAIENRENIECLVHGQGVAYIFTNEKERADFGLQVRDYLRLMGALD